MRNDDDPEALRAAVLARYKSVYAFCKANRGRIGKSVVVLVLAGRYPGNVPRQSARIRECLAAPPESAGKTAPRIGDIMTALAVVACRHCTHRPKKRKCLACEQLWKAQARAVLDLIDGGGHEQIT